MANNKCGLFKRTGRNLRGAVEGGSRFCALNITTKRTPSSIRQPKGDNCFSPRQMAAFSLFCSPSCVGLGTFPRCLHPFGFLFSMTQAPHFPWARAWAGWWPEGLRGRSVCWDGWRLTFERCCFRGLKGEEGEGLEGGREFFFGGQGGFGGLGG